MIDKIREAVRALEILRKKAPLSGDDFSILHTIRAHAYVMQMEIDLMSRSLIRMIDRVDEILDGEKEKYTLLAFNKNIEQK